jgi:DNA polymerase-4
MKHILHVDMNAFFASVEQRADPRLRGLPMAVIGSEHRGVILSPSYEARAFGVRTGMLYHEARQACPEIALVTADPEKYACVCRRLIRIWERFTPKVELFSIDEAFLDVTGCDDLFGDPVRIAMMLKEKVWKEEALTCSIGIAPNRLLAKLGSDMLKPDGLVLICPEDIPGVLQDLPVGRLCGVGPHLTRALAALGIRTCGELGRAPLGMLAARFGIAGQRLRNMGLGIDSDEVSTSEEQEQDEVKSIGHSMTLDRDATDREELERCMFHLSEQVGRRARRGGYSGRTVTLTVRYADFRTFSRQRRLDHGIRDGLDIFTSVRGLFRAIRLEQPVRLIGVALSNLDRALTQVPLFDEQRKRLCVTDAMDDINDRYGEFTVTWGTLADRFRHERVLSPAWRPGGAREY